MKIITVGIGIRVETPFLRQEEAAKYCGVSIRKFQRSIADNVKAYGIPGTPLYHSAELKSFLEEEPKNEGDKKWKCKLK